jgi:hypothetical protein
MIELLDAATAFPTVVFTALLAVVALYWCFVIVGALDHDVLGAAHGATGAHDGASDALVDGVTADGGSALGHEGLPAVLNALGIRGVPLTVWLSVVILFSWAFTLLGMQFAGPAAAQVLNPVLSGALVALAGVGASLAATAVVVRPLSRLNVTHTAVGHRALVGKVCRVTTLRVDAGFGQAEIADGGAGLLVQVRCAEPNDLTRGSEALIFDYDPGEGYFHVARFDDAPNARAVERRLRTPD